MTDRITSFISAQNFCTGSQTDYSTCIANNMRFSEFSDDNYKASQFAGLSIRNTTVPYLYGDTFVDLTPVAIANILSRIMMTNDYGAVSFRCSEVFNRPSLPLPKLQDLGIPSQDILNIIGIDPTQPAVSSPLMFEDIPLDDGNDVPAWMLNTTNLLIGYTTAVSKSMNYSKELTGIILGSLNYYELPDLSIKMKEELEKAARIYNKYLEQNDLLKTAVASEPLIYNIALISEDYATRSYNQIASILNTIDTKVIDPLSIITPDTDFTDFDFTITDQVAADIKNYQTNEYSMALSYGYVAKQVNATYGIPPVYPINEPEFANKVILNFSGMLSSIIAEMLNQIKSLYSSYSLLYDSIDRLEANNLMYESYRAHRNFYSNIAKDASNDPDYEALADELGAITNLFSLNYDSKYLPVEVLAVYDPDDSSSMDEVATVLDDYFDTIGNASSIELYKLISAQHKATSIERPVNTTEVLLGGNYNDSGTFYYADIAYAVGYGKLKDIKSIQIDDEYYELDAIVDDQGVPVRGISEAGCTRYKFTRHVLPTYDVEVEMYIYPGTLDQPYCPTINKYHNFATSKYYGMFTKIDGDNMGVYVYRGYQPMYATVEEVIKLGEMDINSINLNDPSLDKSSYEYMLMTEIKNLTNASAINGSPLTTNDLKYYLASELVYEQNCANYPGLAIIEFKNFPLGNSPKLPKIKVNIVSEDLAV